jgi:phosphoribosylamine-glycine ligase
VARASSFAAAMDQAYRAASRVSFDHLYMRTDIGRRARDVQL